MGTFHKEVSLVERVHRRSAVISVCKVKIEDNSTFKICEFRIPIDSLQEVREYLLEVTSISDSQSDCTYLFRKERDLGYCILCRKVSLFCSCICANWLTRTRWDEGFQTKTWQKIGLVLLEPLLSNSFPFTDFGQGIFLFSLSWGTRVRFNIVYLHPISPKLECASEDPVLELVIEDLDCSFVSVEWDGVQSCCFPLSYFLGNLRKVLFDIVKERFPPRVNENLSSQTVPNLEAACLNRVFIECLKSRVRCNLPFVFQKRLDKIFEILNRNTVAPLLNIIYRRFFPTDLVKIVNQKAEKLARRYVECA